MNNKNDIRTLTERFFLGETTLAEEQQLYQLYQREEIPQDLQPYRQMFLDMQAIAPDTVAEVRPLRSTHIRRWLVAASLALVIGFSIFFLFHHQQHEECVAYIYGQKTTDINVIMAEMKHSAEAMTTDAQHDIVESQLNEMFNIE